MCGQRFIKGMLAGAVVMVSMAVFTADPSSIPEQDITVQKKLVERWRICADLDGDGVQDMMLSGGPATFGNAGGSWGVYLSRDGEYLRLGDIFAHPMAIAIEPDRDRYQTDENKRRYARIWTYSRGSASSGMLGYYRVGEKTVDTFECLEVYPGDGGTCLGNGVIDAVFKESPVPFTLEYSSTDENGNLLWTKK